MESYLRGILVKISNRYVRYFKACALKERYHLKYIPNILKDILNGDM